VAGEHRIVRMVRTRLFQVVGVLGTAEFIVFFALRPYNITPDKLFLFLLFVFMAVRHARELMIRLGPFVLILLVYESLRGLAPIINHRVEYTWMPHMDERIFGTLPTAWLQEHWWHGHVRWLDYTFYAAYLGHFVVPVALALAIWRWRESEYWRYLSTLVIVSFAGFATFVAFPAAPPWMASDEGAIEPIHRIGYSLWESVGVTNIRTLYGEVAPNTVAAVPSLHAAYAIIVAIFAFRLFGVLVGLLVSIHPALVCVGIVYLGEHYAIDAIVGAVYAVGAYALTSWLFRAGVDDAVATRARAWAARIRGRPRARAPAPVVEATARPESIPSAES
jgi:membrane-associated phospholipid phosphatase